jgi:hypothetical protein
MEEQPVRKEWDEFMKSDPNEGRIVGVRYTLDGEKPVIRQQGKDVEMELPAEPFQGLHEEWKVNKHRNAMFTISKLVDKIKREFPLRKLPLLRGELLQFGVKKKTIEQLQSFGLVQERIVSVEDERNGNKKVGARVIVYFTSQGRAYINAVLEEIKERKNAITAVTSNPANQGVDNEHGRVESDGGAVPSAAADSGHAAEHAQPS